MTERNWYLTGFTLFLSLILSRTYSLILELVRPASGTALVAAVTRLTMCFWSIDPSPGGTSYPESSSPSPSPSVRFSRKLAH